MSQVGKIVLNTSLHQAPKSGSTTSNKLPTSKLIIKASQQMKKHEESKNVDAVMKDENI